MTSKRPATFSLIVLSMLVVALTCAWAQEDAGGAPAGAAAPEKAVPAPPPHPKGPHYPPKNLHFVDGHWTPYDPPTVPEGSQAYTIVPGDTLWDLSGKFLGNVLLWPQLWDNNRYILDSHWIYPGDPLQVPAPPTVVPPVEETAEAGAGEGEMEGEEEMEEGEMAEAAPAAPQPVELADITDLHCSPYIDSSYDAPAMRIGAADENAKVHQAEGDIVYLNRGAEDGVTVGSEFDVIRPFEKVRNPITGRKLGVQINRLGRVRVIAAESSTCTAEIVFSCLDMVVGDRLVPAFDPEAPVDFPAEPIDRFATEPTGKAVGTIVTSEFLLQSMGQGNIVQIDLGSEDGVHPGDWLNIFRPNAGGPEYARKMLGTGLVITVQPGTAAVKIAESVREIYPGDRVELR